MDEAIGVIRHNTARRADFLYRVSLKCLVRNDQGEVLVVKERGRSWWDLPGGGMDHGEAIEAAIAREMKEEVNLQGDFSHRIIAVENPGHLPAQNIWQLRLVFALIPKRMAFSAGNDGDEVAFMDPNIFKDSPVATERLVYRYAQY